MRVPCGGAGDICTLKLMCMGARFIAPWGRAAVRYIDPTLDAMMEMNKLTRVSQPRRDRFIGPCDIARLFCYIP